MQLLEGRQNLSHDLLLSDTLVEACLPRLNGLARVIVGGDAEVVAVHARLKRPRKRSQPTSSSPVSGMDEAFASVP